MKGRETAVKPGLREYREYLRDYPVIPVWKETPIAGRDPISTLERLEGAENLFLLESVEKGGVSGRYTFIGFEPDFTAALNGGIITISEKRGKRRIESKNADPMYFLENYLKRWKSPRIGTLPPFSGGAVGYAGYDYSRYVEKLPSTTIDDIKMPEYFFMMAKKVIVFDHAEDTIKIITNSRPGKNPVKSYERAAGELEEIEKAVADGPPGGEVGGKSGRTRFESNVTKESFCDSVKKAKDYIRRGEIFQVVLSQRLKTTLNCGPLNVYRRLRLINPSPYMFYLKTGGNYLIGSSPETHVKVIGGKVTIRPIAGTRSRGKNGREDRLLEKQLLADEKERAEHIMLVDLARNDLGRVARPGSVRVDELMKVWKYSHVMHIESNVTGMLAAGKNRFDVFASSFPAGTVSGAPKIRAMEIIDELEPTRRGTYAGAVGYFSFSGNMDTCITIRTILIKGKEVYLQAGAGIVADSSPENEYRETINKAKALTEALS